MTAARELAILEELSPAGWHDLKTVCQACRLSAPASAVGADLRTLVATGLVLCAWTWTGFGPHQQEVYRLAKAGVARREHLRALDGGAK